MKPKIIIIIRGGVVVGIRGLEEAGVVLEVHDYDVPGYGSTDENIKIGEDEIGSVFEETIISEDF